MKLYLEVTQDELSLPCAVGRNAPELARMVGTTESNVFSHITLWKAGKRKYPRFISVDVPDDD